MSFSDAVGGLSDALRGAMLRFARRHLRPLEEAEDVVQEAVLVLLEAPERPQQADDPRRYIFGILKHKITDQLRRRYREPQVTTAGDDDAAFDEALFDERGHWREDVAPAEWGLPEAQLRSQQFLAAVEACIEALPAKVGRVFSMKTVLDCEADEICGTLGLSKADYWQCLSRARKQLQLCLDQRGLGVRP